MYAMISLVSKKAMFECIIHRFSPKFSMFEILETQPIFHSHPLGVFFYRPAYSYYLNGWLSQDRKDTSVVIAPANLDP